MGGTIGPANIRGCSACEIPRSHGTWHLQIISISYDQEVGQAGSGDATRDADWNDWSKMLSGR
jgi:hypothetical protein